MPPKAMTLPTVPTGLDLWNTIAETDPDRTKEVQRGGRKYTTPNAQYQIMRITQQCGPVGIGWGYHVEGWFVGDLGDPASNPVYVANVTVWLYDRANTYGPITALNQMYQRTKSGMMFDEDAPKKAITDALTKALSHAGMSADIYLGYYDDVEYVASLKELAGESVPAVKADVAKGQPMRKEPLPAGKAEDFWARRVLALPVNRNNDDEQSFNWRQWATRMGHAANAAPSPALLEKLLADNMAAYDAFGMAGEPELYNELVTTIASARRKFQPKHVQEFDGSDTSHDDVPFD